MEFADILALVFTDHVSMLKNPFKGFIKFEVTCAIVKCDKNMINVLLKF